MPLIQVDVEVDVDLDDIVGDIDPDYLLDHLDGSDIADYAERVLDMLPEEEVEELKRKAELYDKLMGGNHE